MDATTTEQRKQRHAVYERLKSQYELVILGECFDVVRGTASRVSMDPCDVAQEALIQLYEKTDCILRARNPKALLRLVVRQAAIAAVTREQSAAHIRRARGHSARQGPQPRPPRFSAWKPPPA